MDIHRIGDPPPEDATRPIFLGHVQTQSLIGEEAESLRLASVHFKEGGRTRLHHHGYDQVLIITEGRGIVATKQRENHVTPGDVLFIPHGEPHWHGAEPGDDMTHISINLVGETELDE